MPKKQKDIDCGVNSDSNTVTKDSTNADAGKAVTAAVNAAVAAADMERVNFRALHCPDKSDTKDCTDKKNITGEKEDIKREVTATYDNGTKKWTAVAKATWQASFECAKAAKKKSVKKGVRHSGQRTARVIRNPF